MTLTVQAITAAKPGDTIRDDEVPGLHLRAFPTRKSFYLYYRTKAGEERRPKLGDYDRVFTLNEARRTARELLREVALGKDPSGKWKADRAGATVDEICTLYEETKLGKRKSARSIKILLRHIRKHLGSSKIAALSLSQVTAMHTKISKTSPIQANRAVAQVSALLTLAERHGQRPIGSNFCRLVERNPETKRRRYLVPGDEAKAVGAALRRRLYGEQHEAALFIFLLLLTGARKSELGDALEVSRNGSTLVVREHKTAGKVGEKVIHLPDAAVALLDDPLRPAHWRTGYLLGVADPRKLWHAVRTEAGCPELRIHDLRHSFASFGLGANIDLSLVAALLSHASTQTTKRYSHLIEGPAKAAVNKIADGVEAALAADKEATECSTGLGAAR